MPALDPVTGVTNLIDDVITRIIPDPAQAAAARLQMAQLYLNGELSQMTAQASIITAEASSLNKWVSGWRPALMYCFILIIFNNYFMAPYLQAMFHFGLQLQIPTDMWDLIRLGVGGYIGGRSLEKISGGGGIKGVIQGIVGQPASQPSGDSTQSIFRGN